MHVPTMDTLQQYAVKTAKRSAKKSMEIDRRGAVRTGLTAGAAMVALSAVSAAVSALRDRSNRP